MSLHLTPPSTIASRVQELTTPGGIKLWFVEERTVPVVTVTFGFKGGSSQDPTEKAGVAHILAEMLTEGQSPDGKRSLDQALSEKAIELAFWADRDAVQGRMRVLARHVGPAFDLLASIVKAPRFETEALPRVVDRARAALLCNRKLPMFAAADRFRMEAYGQHPYGVARHGTVESLPSITRDDLVQTHHRLFSRDGLFVSLVGAINAEQALVAVDRVFADLPAIGCRHVISRMTIGQLGVTHVADVNSVQSALLMGRPGIIRTDPDFAAAKVVNHCFGGGAMTSRLFHEVRRKRGLAYSVVSSLESFEKAAVLLISTSTQNERVGILIDVVANVVRSIRDAGLADDEIVRAKSYLIGSDALRFDTSVAIASQLLDAQMGGFALDWLVNRNTSVADVSPEDVRRVADRLFGDHAFVVAVAGRPILFKTTNFEMVHGREES